jgi:hypothetical protein
MFIAPLRVCSAGVVVSRVDEDVVDVAIDPILIWLVGLDDRV